MWYFRKDKSNAKLVEEAHDFFGKGDTKLYATLIREELKEALAEVKSGDDRIALLKEVCDLIWVAYGFGLTSFTAEEINLAMQEVHRSNMSKRCTREQAEAWIPQQNEPYEFIDVINGLGFVRKTETGKYGKGPNYHLPNL